MSIEKQLLKALKSKYVIDKKKKEKHKKQGKPVEAQNKGKIVWEYLWRLENDIVVFPFDCFYAN